MKLPPLLMIIMAVAACLMMVLGANFIAIGIGIMFSAELIQTYALIGIALPVAGVGLIVFGGATLLSVAREAPA